MVFHFEDINGNILEEYDLLDVSRGGESKIATIKAVNEGLEINNVIIKIVGSDYVKLRLPPGNRYVDEISFPLEENGEQLFNIIINLPLTIRLGPDSCDLLAIIDFNYNIEN